MMYYVLFAVFIAAFVIETIVTGSVLIHHQHADRIMSTWMKWWAIVSMAVISASNILGLIWLKHNHDTIGVIDRGNWVQSLFAISTTSLFIWALILHRRMVLNSQ